MKEQHIDIPTADGNMNSFVACPEEGGPFPPVLFYMDAPGKREELHDMARRIASVGYFVVLPNLYYREIREIVPGSPDASRERMFAFMGALSNAMVCEDTAAMLQYVDGQSDATDGPVGIVGYCMSGPFVFAAASEFPDRIACSASVHGVKLFTDEPTSPHLDAHKIQGEMYFGCAEFDDYAPPEMIESLDTHLKSTDINYRIEWYPGTQHGFVFPTRTGMYEKHAAERHWERLFAMFARNLK